MTDPDQLPERIRRIVESNVLVPDVKVGKLAEIIATERARADALQAELDKAIELSKSRTITKLYEQQLTRADALEAALLNYMSAFGQALEAHGIQFGAQQKEADAAARALLEKKT